MTPASITPRIKETPLEMAAAGMNVFSILFCELFVQPRVRFVAAAVYRKACALMRGIEAMMRRIVITRAAALVPDLPPVKPARAQTAAPRDLSPAERLAGADTPDQPAPDQPAPETPPDDAPLGKGCFHLLLRVASEPEPVRAPGARHAPTNPPQTHFAFAPLGRRWNALVAAMAGCEAIARRAAFRIRAMHASKGLIQVRYGVRIDPDHAAYLEPWIDIFTCDANEALRELYFPDSS